MESSGHHTWPVGELQPNDLGLFDIHGNVFEWIQQQFYDYELEGVSEDGLGSFTVIEKNLRLLRSGLFDYPAKYHRSADRNYDLPAKRDAPDGFRLSRTIK
jgi:formylglycine-generating enzyme required for sulfatase activity